MQIQNITAQADNQNIIIIGANPIEAEILSFFWRQMPEELMPSPSFFTKYINAISSAVTNL